MNENDIAKERRAKGKVKRVIFIAKGNVYKEAGDTRRRKDHIMKTNTNMKGPIANISRR